MNTTTQLPPDLPVPVDDGACDHLPGSRLPSVALRSVAGDTVDPGALGGTVVMFFYPMIARPETGPPAGWDAIPGARGCTPQSCSFRDHHAEMVDLGARVYGVSAQAFDDQVEAAERLQLPYALLNDAELDFAGALRMPTFDHEGASFIKRITLIARDGTIETVFYPVFPPGSDADDVVEWLRQNPGP